MSNEEQGMRKKERGMGNEERVTGSGEWESVTRNKELGMQTVYTPGVLPCAMCEVHCVPI